MVDLTEIDRTLRSPLQSLAQKIRDTLAIQRGHFGPDLAVVQHAGLVDRHRQKKFKPVVVRVIGRQQKS